jgi:hypothetical protein
MFVKLLVGNRASQIVDMKYETAKTLVDNHRAERVNFDRPEPEASIPVAPKPSPTPATKKKKK